MTGVGTHWIVSLNCSEVWLTPFASLSLGDVFRLTGRRQIHSNWCTCQHKTEQNGK
jgi:hypothetical protein